MARVKRDRGEISISRFDLQAGAKAAYQEVCRRSLFGNAPKWEDLTAPKQYEWVQIVRVAIYAAKEIKTAKERKLVA